jgi:hypothetical protein
MLCHKAKIALVLAASSILGLGCGDTEAVRAVDISAGTDETCALLNDGSALCWSTEDNAVPGRFTALTASGDGLSVVEDGRAFDRKADGLERTLASVSDVVDLLHTFGAGFGPHQVCALRLGGHVVCSTANAGDTIAVEGSYASLSVSPGSCGVHTDGTLGCWSPSDGSPQEIELPSGAFSEIAAYDSGENTGGCALRGDGTLACFGCDGFSLGSPPPGSYLSVSVRYCGACAVRFNGEAVCWGAFPNGVPDLPYGDFVQVTLGSGHMCLRTKDGLVACRGRYVNEGGVGVPAVLALESVPSMEP